jgi:(S)-mandelate dehydrogenase
VLSLRAKLDVLLHLRWMFNVLLPRGLVGFGNLAEFLPVKQRKALPGAHFMALQANTGVTWESLRAIRERWKRKLVIKGVMAVSDAEEAVRLGADGIILSNHGGRQLDSEAAPIEMLESVVAAVGEKVEVMVDGGFRRGTDVVKALALGARAVLLGRATLYGLAAGGEAGAARALAILHAEIEATMALLGCPSVDQLSPRVLFGRDDTNRSAIDLGPGRRKMAARDA